MDKNIDYQTVRRILDKYGVEHIKVLPCQAGYRSQSWPVLVKDDNFANLIFYKREAGILERIRRANLVSGYLSAKGFSTRTTIKPAIIRLQRGPVIRYGALYNYLPGSTIPWEGYTTDHIKLLGMAMSNMHAALRSYSPCSPHSITDEYLRIVKRMSDYFAGTGVQLAMDTKLGLKLSPWALQACECILMACKNLPAQQTLHMDFVRGNVLFREAYGSKPGQLRVGKQEISGILDFEKTGVGHPVLDIARTLAFLLVDCRYKTEAQVKKYFLYSGYNKRGAAEFRSINIRSGKGLKVNLLDRLVALFLLHDFYKFLCHNPYESLDQNRHFVRTRDLLIGRGLVGRTNAKMYEVKLTGVC